MDKEISPFISEVTAKQAVRMVLPAIMAMMETGQMKREALHLVILDPMKPYGSCSFANAILWQFSIGNKETWDYEFDVIARSKAKITWKTKLANRVVHNSPWLFSIGDTKYIGSAVSDDGTLIVAASGVQDYYDELCSKMVLAALQALIFEAEKKTRSEDGDYY